MESEVLWRNLRAVCQRDVKLMQEVIDDLQNYVNDFIESEGSNGK
jgi:hypothetical protein